MMEAPHLRQRSAKRNKKRNWSNKANIRKKQEKSTFSSENMIYYTLLFLKVALWITIAWSLSHLHMGAPCFLLMLTGWLYSGPMQSALIWAKRRLQSSAASTVTPARRK